MLCSDRFIGMRGRGSPRSAPIIAAGNPQPVNRGDPPEGEVYSIRGLSAGGPMYIAPPHGELPRGSNCVPVYGIWPAQKPLPGNHDVPRHRPDVHRVRQWNGIKDAGPPGRAAPWYMPMCIGSAPPGTGRILNAGTATIPMCIGRGKVMQRKEESRRGGICASLQFEDRRPETEVE